MPNEIQLSSWALVKSLKFPYLWQKRYLTLLEDRKFIVLSDRYVPLDDYQLVGVNEAADTLRLDVVSKKLPNGGQLLVKLADPEEQPLWVTVLHAKRIQATEPAAAQEALASPGRAGLNSELPPQKEQLQDMSEGAASLEPPLESPLDESVQAMATTIDSPEQSVGLERISALQPPPNGLDRISALQQTPPMITSSSSELGGISPHRTLSEPYYGRKHKAATGGFDRAAALSHAGPVGSRQVLSAESMEAIEEGFLRFGKLGRTPSCSEWEWGSNRHHAKSFPSATPTREAHA